MPLWKEEHTLLFQPTLNITVENSIFKKYKELEMAQKITLLLEDSTIEALSYWVYKRKENRCEIIRSLLEKGLTELEEEEKVQKQKSTWTYRGHS